jgi:glutamine synthetase
MNYDLSMNANQLVAFLQKPTSEFTKADIISFIQQKDIRMVNFMYPAGDGRLKTLNFVINNQAYLEAILTCGERVDGSSLFSFIEAGSSDLYVIPRFLHSIRLIRLPRFRRCPCFALSSIKTVNHLKVHQNILFTKQARLLQKLPEWNFKQWANWEYYVIAPDTGMFQATDQRGYHESGPYAKFNEFRTQCMSYIAQTGGQIKYGHSEVGNFTLDGIYL